MGVFQLRQLLLSIIKVKKTGFDGGIKFTFYQSISEMELDEMAEEFGDIRQSETWQKLSRGLNMTLSRLRFLAQTVENCIQGYKQLLLTTDPEIYGEEYQRKISEASQHLYQIKRAIETFEKDVAHLEICLKLKFIKSHDIK